MSEEQLRHKEVKPLVPVEQSGCLRRVRRGLLKGRRLWDCVKSRPRTKLLEPRGRHLSLVPFSSQPGPGSPRRHGAWDQEGSPGSSASQPQDRLADGDRGRAVRVSRGAGGH